MDRLPRKDEILEHRLRFGHMHQTHANLLKEESPPECTRYRRLLTVEYTLIGCANRNSIYLEIDSASVYYWRNNNGSFFVASIIHFVHLLNPTAV